MYKTFYTCLVIFWILDFCNLPFMEIFDTLYPINDVEWFFIWLFLGDGSW